ncbi:MAG: FHA domain-containing protein [Coriobacteriia bacterium]|nr:FHA domain-containing protein [Coriobacteriia bacterium]
MAELICPQCERALDENYYCSHCCNTFKPVKEENIEENIEEEQVLEDSCCEDSSSDYSELSTSEARCTNCGAPGQPGEECIQCGKIIPNESLCTSSQNVSIDAAFLVLPNGLDLRLESGKDYLIGRESDVSEIKNALGERNNVSREHCYIRIDYSSCSITINDNGSTNGTYIGDGETKVINGQTYPLPINI